MSHSYIRNAVEQCQKYVPGKPVEEVQRELGLTDIIKMASNENPLGASPKAIEAMVRELQNSANRYPESLSIELIERLAEKHRVASEQILVDNGLDGVITTLGMTCIDPGDEVIYGAPSFPAYENITRKMGGTCVPVALTADYRLDLDAMARAVTEKTKIILVCNPNNPTGTINSSTELEHFLAQIPTHVLIALDEAYCDFVDDPEYPDSLNYLSRYENIAILRTFSKIMGLAAQRIGYIVTNKALIESMLRIRQPFPVNRAAQAGAIASLEDYEFVRRTLTLNREGRKQYRDAFDEMGLSYTETQTNFVYVELPDLSAAQIFEEMLKAGVIVRPQSALGRPDALRITIGTAQDNVRTIAALKEAISIIKKDD